ncbi:cell division protein FtsL [Lentilactobacillus raoultii]|uniref:Cell division protein FtsL n=1 Tax=Lentilactobacillus raoultii TaxID=1987503 RepID=A0ABW3PNL5_9LACO|nr:cell division protein FtsL [Lentilactobacillus raoultii]
MAQNNLARNLTQEEPEQPYVSTPRRVSQPGRQPGFSPRLRLNAFEKVLIIGGSILLTGLMLMVVSSKIALSNSQHELQHLDTRISNIHNDNTNLKQQIGELQSSSRLQKIAKENGMSLSNGNIRNVTK